MPRIRHVFLVALTLLFVTSLLWTYSGTTQHVDAVINPDLLSSNDDIKYGEEDVGLVYQGGPPPTPPPPPPTTVYVEVETRSPMPEPVVLAFVTIGAGSAREGAIALKSALMHASRAVHIHVVCTEDARAVLEARFALFDRPAYPVEVFYYTVTHDHIRARGERAGVGHNWSQLVKLFIHELLVDVERAIFVDTDMIFVVDPLQLWNNFYTLSEKALLSFPSLGENAHSGEICTCVMLMDLAKMRAAPFMPSTLRPHDSPESLATVAMARAAADGIPNPHGSTGGRIPFSPFELAFGDQSIYHVVWMYWPELFAPLSQRWDVTNCRAGYGLSLGGFRAKDAKGRPDGDDVTEIEQVARQEWSDRMNEKFLSPGILHFNCQQGENVWEIEDNHRDNTWAPMITTAERFKWAWLNRGSAKVRSTRVSDVRWEDERLAEQADARDNLKHSTHGHRPWASRPQ